MNILLIGSGGREHALALKISESPNCDQLFITPGNPGTATCGENVAIGVSDFEALKGLCEDKDISIIIVGPEQPLVEGIKDYINKELPKVYVVGPSARGAMLEGSKAFAKEFMGKYDIPTASYFECSGDNVAAGLAHLETMSAPYVLKADGLAAGKGVLIIDNLQEAKAELKSMLSGKFGTASSRVVIEQFLDGIEYSVFVLTDGKDYIILPEAKDYKRIGEGDTGLNTGGMGAVSPVSFVDQELTDKVTERIIAPTIKGLHEQELDYVGFVFFGLIVVEGEPFVIEYNCRMGDPETEVVMPRLKSDLVEAITMMRDGNLNDYKVVFEEQAAAAVILVSGGYPEAYEKGKVISNVEQANCQVFHAGTKTTDGQLVTSGGRVMALTSFADDFMSAVANSLEVASTIEFEGKNYRKDIGFDL